MHGGSWGRPGRAGPTGLCVCGCPAPGPAGRRARARLSCEQSSTHLHIRVIMMAAAVPRRWVQMPVPGHAHPRPWPMRSATHLPPQGVGGWRRRWAVLGPRALRELRWLWVVMQAWINKELPTNSHYHPKFLFLVTRWWFGGGSVP